MATKDDSVETDRIPPLTPSASLRLPAVNLWLSRLAPHSIVEAGCGMGSMACRLAQRFDYRGYEPDRSSYEVAAKRLEMIGRGHVVNGVLPATPDRTFDLLVAFEVLEHIEDDQAALRDWCRWVKPGGHVLLSVPSDPDRFGPCDELVGHFRRYDRQTLRQVMEKAGLTDIEVESWGMPVGYLLQWVRDFRAARHPSRGEVGTAGSGRLHQPHDRAGRVVQSLSGSLAVLQRPFRKTDLGVGYIAVGRLRAAS